MRLGKSNVERVKYVMNEELKEIEMEKDLGVMIDDESLKFTVHLARKSK